MQWHCLAGGVSAKPELINHIGPEITDVNSLLGASVLHSGVCPVLSLLC